jgi:propionyl-CoA carboxylase alpha chain
MRDAGSGRHRHPVPVPADWTVLIGAAPRRMREVRVEGDAVSLDGKTRQVRSAWRPGDTLFEGSVDGAPVTAQIDRKGIAWQLSRAGATIEMLVVSRRTGNLSALMPVKVAADLSKFLLSPMPGLLVSIAVQEGQDVKAGDELAVVEAMKMENLLRAERDGKVKKIHAAARDSLAVDQMILEFQ